MTSLLSTSGQSSGPTSNVTTKTLYVFRHGETDWNREGRLQGSTDIPLNDKGREQALKLREFFRGHPVEVFLSSDLGRAKETAEIARGELQVPIIIEPGIRETNLGDAEGLTHDEIDARLGEGSLASWYQTTGPNGGNFRFRGGETKNEHLQRIMESLDRFVRTTDYRVIGVATHGGAMRRLIHHLAPDLKEPIMVGNCSVYEVTFEVESGKWTVDLQLKCAW